MASNTSASRYVHLNVSLKECISNSTLPQVKRKEFFFKNEQGQVVPYTCLVIADFPSKCGICDMQRGASESRYLQSPSGNIGEN